MPAGTPRFASSRPRQSSALPEHPRQRLMATHQDTFHRHAPSLRDLVSRRMYSPCAMLALCPLVVSTRSAYLQR